MLASAFALTSTLMPACHLGTELLINRFTGGLVNRQYWRILPACCWCNSSVLRPQICIMILENNPLAQHSSSVLKKLRTVIPTKSVLKNGGVFSPYPSGSSRQADLFLYCWQGNWTQRQDLPYQASRINSAPLLWRVYSESIKTSPP